MNAHMFCRRGLLLAVMLFAMAATAPQAGASSLALLYSFCAKMNSNGVCTDGVLPEAGVILDKSGNVFGTTYEGGAHNDGVVFEISGGKEKILHNFCNDDKNGVCVDGIFPINGVIADTNGNLYGTAQEEGANDGNSGNVFELVKNPTTGAFAYKVLYNFCSLANCADGGDAMGGLLMDSAGHLYGTTLGGGVSGNGTVYELAKNKKGKWLEHVLWNFCGAFCPGGQGPQSTLVMDGSGHLYGITGTGGKEGSGVVFELTKSAKGKWSEKVLHAFCSDNQNHTLCLDGATPTAGLTFAGSGQLYGTTSQGGYGDPGFGTVYGLKFDTSSGKWVFKVIHRFCNPKGHCTDGLNPEAGVIVDSGGNIDGATVTSSSVQGNPNEGTLFSVTPAGKETILLTFCGGSCTSGGNNGSTPHGTLLLRRGGFYGTTLGGGANNEGEVFEFKP